MDKKRYNLIIITVLTTMFLTIALSRAVIGKYNTDIENNKKVTKVELFADSNKVSDKVPLKVDIKIEPIDAYIKDLEWEIQDKDIIDIKQNLIYGKSKGKTKVKLKNNYIFSNELEIETVDFLSSIEVENKIKALPIRTEHKYNIKYIPKTAENQKISIESTDPNIISVNNENLSITGKNKGKSKIILRDSFKNILYEETIEVKWDRITNILLDEKEITIGKGQKYLIHAKIEPEFATHSDIIWNSSNENVASIDNLGIVTANNKGTTIIEATADDRKIKATYILNVVDTKLYNLTKYANLDFAIYPQISKSYNELAKINKFEPFEIIKKIENNYYKVRNKDGMPGIAKIDDINELLNKEPVLVKNFPHEVSTEIHNQELQALKNTLLFKNINITNYRLKKIIPIGKPITNENDKMLGGDPNLEFVGNPFETGNYGAYETVIYKLLKNYIYNVKLISEISKEEMEEKISSGSIFIVWAGKVENGKTWHSKNGKEHTEKLNKNTLIIKGFTDTSYIVNDYIKGEDLLVNKVDLQEEIKLMGNNIILIE